MSKANGAIKIEKGVPLPTWGDGSRWPLKQMKAGDSFVTSAADRTAIYNAARYAKTKVAVRKEGADQIRIWRKS